jgi:predicted GNAT family N-acyltransferase
MLMEFVAEQRCPCQQVDSMAHLDDRHISTRQPFPHGHLVLPIRAIRCVKLCNGVGEIAFAHV